MCGIVGFAGNTPALPILLRGLEKLEYRGYDSAGIGLIEHGALVVRRAPGKLVNLKTLLDGHTHSGVLGIGHTRWATHGKATKNNAHPHVSLDGTLAVVHNGIINNHALLREKLTAEGVTFVSETDTEVIAHLLRKLQLEGHSLEEAMQRAMAVLNGTYAIAVISSSAPDTIWAVANRMPLYIGVGEEGNSVASDQLALLGVATEVMRLENRQLATLRFGSIPQLSWKRMRVDSPFTPISVKPEDVDIGGYAHYLRKEIADQPVALARALAGRVSEDGEPHFAELREFKRRLRGAKRVILAGCGTSYHAGLAGARFVERIAGIPAHAVLASEFQYARPVLRKGDVFVALSQSGETADTREALALAQRDGVCTISITNRSGSDIALRADANIDMRAGAEVSVASTKAYTVQVALLGLLACYLTSLRSVASVGFYSRGSAWEAARGIRDAPHYAVEAIETEAAMRDIASQLVEASHILFVGRGEGFIAGAEGALKVFEVSYLPATAYPGGEFKHGPLAGIDEGTPVIALAPDKLITSNLHEIAARGGRRFILGVEGDEEVQKLAHRFVGLPDMPEELVPLVYAIPLQLLAYHLGLFLGRDIDKPRNLAKSVTVE